MATLKDLAWALADEFLPLAYAAGKGAVAIYSFTHIGESDTNLQTAIKAGIGIYCGLSGLLDAARGLRGANAETLGPDKTYQTNGNFVPWEVAVVRNVMVNRRNVEMSNSEDSRTHAS